MDFIATHALLTMTHGRIVWDSACPAPFNRLGRGAVIKLPRVEEEHV